MILHEELKRKFQTNIVHEHICKGASTMLPRVTLSIHEKVKPQGQPECITQIGNWFTTVQCDLAH